MSGKEFGAARAAEAKAKHSEKKVIEIEKIDEDLGECFDDWWEKKSDTAFTQYMQIHTKCPFKISIKCF